jgi:hypothetical protein
MITTTLNYPSIDRLLERFGSESRPFFVSLSRAERKELQKYCNYRKAAHKDNWGFSPYTVTTLDSIDRRAEQFYQQRLKYTQLIIPCFHCEDLVNMS